MILSAFCFDLRFSCHMLAVEIITVSRSIPRSLAMLCATSPETEVGFSDFCLYTFMVEIK